MPAELFDPDAAPWRSQQGTVEWCWTRGVEPPASLAAARTPDDRLVVVVGAWAVAAGHAVGPRGRAPDREWLERSGLGEVARGCTRRKVERIKRRAFGRGTA